MKAEEKKAIEWLKNKHEECTSLIASCSYIGNKKAYAKDRTQYKILINLVEKQEKIIDNSISKDKIREKINELETELKDEKYTHDMYEGTIKYNEYLGLVAKHNILKELLKEE